MLYSNETLVNTLSAITQKSDKKLWDLSKLISRENAENVNLLLLARYNKVLPERDELKKELVILQTESRGTIDGSVLARLENKTGFHLQSP